MALFQARHLLSDSKVKVNVEVQSTVEQATKPQRGTVSDGLPRSGSCNCDSMPLGILSLQLHVH